MEKNISKRLIACLLTVLMIFSTISVTAFAVESEQIESEESIVSAVIDESASNVEYIDVNSSHELEAALAEGEHFIRIAKDFELDRTFYITYDVKIVSTEKRVLTRAEDFVGDIFVTKSREL